MPRRPKADFYKGMQCAARDCSALTRPRSRYCGRHARRLRLYGHPEAKPTTDADLIYFAGLAGKVFERNANHAGLRLACEELEALLGDAGNRAQRGEDLDATMSLWSRVAAASCEARVVLATICAAVLREQLGGRPAPNNRAYVVSVGRAVLALTATRSNKPAVSASTLYGLGEFLLTRYGSIAMNVVVVVRKDHEQAQRRQVLVTTPLK